MSDKVFLLFKKIIKSHLDCRKNQLFNIALLTALTSCISSKPVVDSTNFQTSRTLVNISPDRFASSYGYQGNADIYDKIGLANAYSYTSQYIAKERIAGAGVKVGVIEVQLSSLMPFAHSSIASNIDSSYLYTNGSMVKTDLQSNSSPISVDRDSSGLHAVNVMSLIIAKRGDQTYSTNYNATNENSYIAFDVLKNDTTAYQSQYINGISYNAKAVYVGVEIGDDVGEQAIPNIINTLYNNGVRTFNMSFGGTQINNTPNYIEEDASDFRDITKSKSVFIAVSAGNSATSNPDDPAIYAGSVNVDSSNLGIMLAVASSNYNTDVLSSYSAKCGSAMNYCITAPGMLTGSTAGTFATVASYRYENSGSYYRPISISQSGSTIQALRGADGRVYTNGFVFSNQGNAENNLSGASDTTYATVISSVSTKRVEVLESTQGTSFSAPIVTAVATNIMAAFPGISGRDVGVMMLKWAKPLETNRTQGQEGTLSSNFGWGMVDYYSTQKAINESTFGYGSSGVTASSVQYTALSLSPAIGGSISAINNLTSNAVFTDQFGYSFSQSLNYKTYAQNGYGGFVNQYNSANVGSMSNFYAGFFLANSHNPGSGTVSLPTGTTVSLDVRNGFYNQGSLLNINHDKLTSGFFLQSQSARSIGSNSGLRSAAIIQSFGKVELGYASNSNIDQSPSSFFSFSGSGATNKSYKLTYNYNSKTSFSISSSKFTPVGYYSMINEFSNTDFSRKLSEFSLRRDFNKKKSFAILSFGAMTENGSFLTSMTNGAFAVSGSNTTYGEAKVSKALGMDFSIDASSSLGVTKVNTLNNSVFSNFSNLVTTSHSIGVEKDNIFFNSKTFSNSLRLGLKMPLSVVRGSATIYNGAQYNTISLAQNSRQLDHEIMYRVANLNRSANNLMIYANLTHSQNFLNIHGLTNNMFMLGVRKSIQ